MEAPKEAGESRRCVAEEETEHARNGGPARKGNSWLCLLDQKLRLSRGALVACHSYIPPLLSALSSSLLLTASHAGQQEWRRRLPSHLCLYLSAQSDNCRCITPSYRCRRGQRKHVSGELANGKSFSLVFCHLHLSIPARPRSPRTNLNLHSFLPFYDAPPQYLHALHLLPLHIGHPLF
jgi:hypothetical protein